MITKTKTKKLPKGFTRVNIGDPIRTGDIFHDESTGGGIVVKSHYCPVGEPYDGSGLLIRAIKHPAPKPAAKGRKAVKAVWVIEMLCSGNWEPCAEAKLTRRDGRQVMNQEWRTNNPYDKFRLVKYTPDPSA